MRKFLPLVTALWAGWSSLASAASSADAPHVKASLVSATENIQAGQEVKVGIHFKMDKNWALSWRNPGDAGEPIQVQWQLPQGVTAESMAWPYPDQIPTGSQLNFGYQEEILLPVTLKVAADVKSPVQVQAAVSWTVCQETCEPGKATLDLSLPLEPEAKPSAFETLFANSSDTLPKPLPPRTQIETQWHNDNVELKIQPVSVEEKTPDVFFFPADRGIITHSASQTVSWNGDQLSIKLATNNAASKPDQLSGVLRVGTRYFTVEPSLKPVTNEALNTSLLQALLLAFIGGMILNGMPCVFPVLSIKAVGLLKHTNSEEDKKRSRFHGIVYAIGVLVSFWLLAGALLMLKAGGEKIGWGFQLQSPYAITGLALLLFAMALNLAGAYEIRASWVGVGHGLASRKEAIGAFFSGVLATVVATPCTAPFMGTALGYAASQPPAIALGVFTSLALGLAFPYVLLSWFPIIGRWMPRPGRWMETLKQVMAFPLFATVIWLLWVLGNQVGTTGVAGALTACLLLAIATWTYQRWQTVKGTVIALMIAVSALALGVRVSGTSGAAVTKADANESGWVPYTQAKLDEFLAAGKPVFIDFTADWCVTCKVNEAAALQPNMVAEMQARGITPMKADWTNDNPEIANALASFGRDGIPLYVLYGKKGTVPKILPQVLTESIVLNAFDEMGLKK